MQAYSHQIDVKNIKTHVGLNRTRANEGHHPGRVQSEEPLWRKSKPLWLTVGADSQSWLEWKWREERER